MKVEDGLNFKHLTGSYYLDKDTGQIYSRYAVDDGGLRTVKHTKKLLEKLAPFLPKRGGKRHGAGRPKTKEDTKVMRVPLSKVEEVQKIIQLKK